MRTDARGSTCTDDIGSACTDVSTESTGVRGSTCSYIPSKVTGVQRVPSTDYSMVKTVVRVRTYAYDKYWRYKPIRYIGTDLVGKVRKDIRYSDSLQQGS